MISDHTKLQLPFRGSVVKLHDRPGKSSRVHGYTIHTLGEPSCKLT